MQQKTNISSVEAVWVGRCSLCYICQRFPATLLRTTPETSFSPESPCQSSDKVIDKTSIFPNHASIHQSTSALRELLERIVWHSSVIDKQVTIPCNPTSTLSLSHKNLYTGNSSVTPIQFEVNWEVTKGGTSRPGSLFNSKTQAN